MGERAGSALHGDRLDVALHTDAARGPDFRLAEITGHGALAQRLLQALGPRIALTKAGWKAPSASTCKATPPLAPMSC